MPIYEYQCARCGLDFERLARRADAKPPACPDCGSRQVRKQFSAFSASVSQGRRDTCSMGQCPSGACAGSGCPMERR